MKKYIEYFYNLKIDKMIFYKGKYILDCDGKKYIFKLCNSLDFVYEIKLVENELQKFDFFFSFVLNKNSKFITTIENRNYVLLKINKSFENSCLSIFDIKTNMYLTFNNSFNKMKRFPWINLWQQKIDYLENWLLNKRDQYKMIYSIFNYFIGISENALMYLKEIIYSNNDISDITIQHDRIGIDTDLYDYYDSTNIVFDHRTRDISEYVKSLWLNGIFDIDDFENYLNYNNFSGVDIKIMYSRIFFPSFFFDNFEFCIEHNNYDNMLLLETKIEDYQAFLEQISILFINKYNVECIKWIKNTS